MDIEQPDKATKDRIEVILTRIIHLFLATMMIGLTGWVLVGLLTEQFSWFFIEIEVVGIIGTFVGMFIKADVAPIYDGPVYEPGDNGPWMQGRATVGYRSTYERPACSCNGTGRCQSCRGSGKGVWAGTRTIGESTCPYCLGSGVCHDCRGTGDPSRY